MLPYSDILRAGNLLKCARESVWLWSFISMNIILTREISRLGFISKSRAQTLPHKSVAQRVVVWYSDQPLFPTQHVSTSDQSIRTRQPLIQLVWKCDASFGLGPMIEYQDDNKKLIGCLGRWSTSNIDKRFLNQLYAQYFGQDLAVAIPNSSTGLHIQ